MVFFLISHYSHINFNFQCGFYGSQNLLFYLSQEILTTLFLFQITNFVLIVISHLYVIVVRRQDSVKYKGFICKFSFRFVSKTKSVINSSLLWAFNHKQNAIYSASIELLSLVEKWIKIDCWLKARRCNFWNIKMWIKFQ